MYQKFFLIVLSIFIFPLVTLASEKDGGMSKGEHQPHPPHSHQEHDHLKYIRGHGTERKRKKVIY